MFTRVRPLGWAFGEILTSAQMNTLDTDHANSVDGPTLGLGFTKTLSYYSSLPAVPDDFTKWRPGTGGGHASMFATDATASRLYFPLRLPHGAIWLSFVLQLRGQAHGGSWPPGVMPFLRAYYQELLNAPTLILSTQDVSAQGVYESTHAYGLSGINTTIDNATKTYGVFVENENGLNAVPGLRVGALYVTYSMTALDFK